MPTAFEMRKKNQQFAARARSGKPTVNPSTREKLNKRSPVGIAALVLLFVVLLGGGRHLRALTTVLLNINIWDGVILHGAVGNYN